MSRLQLLEPDAHKLVKAITQEVFDEIYNRLRNRRKGLVTRIQQNLVREFAYSPTVQSLQSGKLKGELGLDGATLNILDQILQVLQDNVKVSITTQRSQQTLSFQFGFDERAYEELFVSGTTFTSTNGYNIEWLKWLLEAGDDIIVIGYKYKNGDFGVHSRSGEGIMIKASGAMWRVPPEFSGTEDKNFITRLFNTTEYEIFNHVSEVIQG